MNKRTRYQLICEGKCNDPHALAHYKRLSEAASKEKPFFNRRRNPQPGMAEALRELKYTQHRKLSFKEARCEICLHRRRFG